MFNLTRRALVVSAAAAAAFGLQKPLRIVSPASAAPLEPSTGFHRFKVGSVEVTAVYDGIWRKPHDPAFIKNASVDETKEALAKAGLTTDFMPIPLTVIVLKIGDRHDHDAMPARASASGRRTPRICRPTWRRPASTTSEIDTILISHFHPDHVWGLMEKGTNAPVFPNAELVVNATEYNWWTDPSRVEKLPEGRKRRRQAHRRRVPDLEELEAGRGRRRGRARRPASSPRLATRPAIRVFLVASGKRAADGLGRHHVRAGAARAASRMAGQLRPGRRRWPSPRAAS